MALMNYFFKFKGHLKFKYDVTNNKWIDIKFIIILVTMTYNKAWNVYTFASADVDALYEFVSSK
jgi:hypothetical protein